MFRQRILAATVLGIMQQAETQQSAGSAAPATAVIKPTEEKKPEVVVPEGYDRTKFHFKETKVDGKKTGVRRATVELNIPVPKESEVLAAFSAAPVADGMSDEDKKAAQNAANARSYIMDLLKDSVFGAAREQVNANENITQEGLDESKLALQYLANLPKAERRGAGISKETWEEFKADYVSVMAKTTGKELDKISLAADLFLNRLQKVKTIKPVIKALRNELSIWFQNTNEKEDFAEVYEFLDGKCETFINADETDMLKQLGAI